MPTYKTPEEPARASADAFLRAQGFNTDDFRHVTFPDTLSRDQDTLAEKYFPERRPVDYASRLFELYRPLRRWSTRYFKSLDREEVGVAVDPQTAKGTGLQSHAA